MHINLEDEENENGYLNGQLLIAMPGITDSRFSKSVIYVCSHNEDGAMGLIINYKAPNINFSELLKQLEIDHTKSDPILLSDSIDNICVQIGGPVETGRGFVLHSPDYFSNDATLAIDENIYLTATVDILRAIASGSGPDKALLALGYSGWSPGQLESEIQHNGWLNCPASAELVFEEKLQVKYQRAFQTLGIDPSHLVNEAGHA